MTEVAAPWHGTVSGYTYHACRCLECTNAQARYYGNVPRSTCVRATGSNSECGQVAAKLAQTAADLKRIGRLASASQRMYAKHAAELAAIKKDRAEAIRRRDVHMSECPGAAERFA